MIRTARELERAGKAGRYVVRTMGQGFALDDGTTVSARCATALQGELFNLPGAAGSFVAQDDGLLPGFSQTWRME